MTALTKQQMFDRAFLGLKAQGFRRCTGEGTSHASCLYQNDRGMRCAWGHVDHGLTKLVTGTVLDLHEEGVGIAATIPREDLDFAMQLQRAHDNRFEEGMEERLRRLAQKYDLCVPQ